MTIKLLPDTNLNYSKAMKRTFLSLMLCLFSVASFAQTQHLKFMGIPLNGSIQNFQQKLALKGFRPNTLFNKTYPTGGRAFKGVFSGKDADVYVYYNPKTKVVYRAKAVIEANNSTFADNLYNTMKEGLFSKYENNSYFTTGEFEGHESITFSVISTKNHDQSHLGWIGLYVTKSEYSWDERNFIHVDYEDRANTDKNEMNNSDDL